MKTKSYDHAYPVSADILEKEALGHFNNAGQSSPFGLTKREHMAIEFTKAIISNGAEMSNQRIVSEAIMIADELIKQLNAE